MFSDVAGARRLRPAAARPPDLGHRPLQLPLHLLHAEGGLRQRLPLSRAAGAARLRGDRRASRERPSRSASRSSGSPAASRSSAATSSSLIAMLAELGVEITLTTNGVAAAAQGRRRSRTRGSTGSRSASTRSTTRLSARMNDVDFPVQPRARRDRRRARGRAAGEGELRRQARRERGPDRPARPLLPRHAAHAPLHRVHGRRRTRTAGGWTTSSRRPRSSRRSTAEFGDRAGRRPLPRRGRAALPLSSTASGEFGVISSVTQPFCGDCTRARLSAEGKLYTCLFAFRGHDLRALLRGGATDDGARGEARRDLEDPRRPLFGAPLGRDGSTAARSR